MGMAFYMIDGYPIIQSEYCCERVQARKHKKKRINKKWAKRYGCRFVPSKDIIVANGYIFVHPKTFAKLREQCKEKNNILWYGERKGNERQN